MKNKADRPKAPSKSGLGNYSKKTTIALKIFFFTALKAPRLLDIFRPLLVTIAIVATPSMRRAVAANARRLLKGEVTKKREKKFLRSVVNNHYRFAVDMARNRSAANWQSCIESVEGKDEYIACRSHLAGREDQQKKTAGAIVVTVHMGSFEAGLAALNSVEAKINVVFQRDRFDNFEKARTKFHQQLNIKELPIDEGLDALVKMRRALLDGEVLVMQGDRAMEGQRCCKMKFSGGHVKLPCGPVLLARVTDSPIVPVCVVRTRGGKFKVILGKPIYPETVGGNNKDLSNSKEMIALKQAIETFVTAHPQQWLALSAMFEEDKQDV